MQIDFVSEAFMLRDVPTQAKSSGSAPVEDILPPAFKAWSGDLRVEG